MDATTLPLASATSDPVPGSTIHSLVTHHAVRSPNAIAVVWQGTELRYGELNDRANRLAHRLRKLGVPQGSLVAIAMERSIDMIVGLLGILKSGCAYLPLDPAYPSERLAYMLADAAPMALLTSSTTPIALPGLPAQPNVVDIAGADLNDEPACDPMTSCDAEALAYVIYTSGSTGQPKGCQVTHGNVVRLFASTRRRFEFGPDDVWTFFHSIAFDFSVWEIWGALVHGGRVVVVPHLVTRTPRDFLELLAREQVTVLSQTPSAFRALIDADRSSAATPSLSLRYVILGGEALNLQMLLPWFDRHGDESPQLVNMYGITETTVHATYRRIRRADLEGGKGSVIGCAIDDLTVWLLDTELAPVAAGVTGEMYIAGAGVCRGYLNRPALNAERFIMWTPPGARQPVRLYKSGDLARRSPDGDLEYLGRIDGQIKLRGFRIETGEIESRLAQHPGVRACAVAARNDGPQGEARLVAYVIGTTPTIPAAELRRYLAERLPEFMVPAAFVGISELPLTDNGKLNRAALPAPPKERHELGRPYVAPATDMQRLVCAVFADQLGLDVVGVDDNYFEIGGTSLLAVQTIEALARRVGREVTIATLFAHPTAAELARRLGEHDAAAFDGRLPAAVRHRAAERDGAIAIIAMAGRFPGASTVEAFWTNLVSGRDAVTDFSPDDLDSSIPASLREHPQYVRARGIVEDIENFDAAFFEIPAHEAQVMDPQHRVFLEIAWECLERAGHAPDRSERPVGVFAGAGMPSYLLRNVLPNARAIERVGELQVQLANDKDYVATRVAYKLNLRGPAISVNTACSTSLVAIAQAVDSLRLGRCAMALAGAASITSPPRSGHLHEDGAMLSDDGRTRSFDADGRGTVFSDGAAVVLLKRLNDALADGDQVYALIRGVATNNDGGGKASFTAPSVDGQAAVIAAAHDDADVDARSISYVEAHGTATPLGDPVEVEGLTRAFRRRTRDTGFCRIGSVKSNVGHLVTAAGAAGVIKTALALHTERLPPSIHFDRPNPKIDFAGSPFVVNDRLAQWPRTRQPRRAGVSSFGVGGTNAHLVMEEAPAQALSSPASGPQLLCLSAKTPSALQAMAHRLADHLDLHVDISLADVAHTLQVGRSKFAHRLCVVGDSVAQAVTALRSTSDAQRVLRSLGATVPSLVWLFPGQGAQYAGMGSGLYRNDGAFRAAFDECAAALQSVLPFDLKSRMFDGDAGSLVATDAAQPAIFCLEYALAKGWLARGARPVALVGHSVGEFVAAVIAGVMSLDDAARLVAVRGALMQSLPAGGMLSVQLPLDSVLLQLPRPLSLAAENGPNACVVAGPVEAVEAWRMTLEGDGIAARALRTSHAFHSSMMDPAVDPFEAEVRKTALSAPRIPIVSTVTGASMTADEALDPRYWARHLREPVRFSAALRAALACGDTALLEIGPRETLTALARQHRDVRDRPPVAIASLGDAPQAEASRMKLAQGELWTLGIDLPAAAASPAHGRRRVLLPTYPFERKRCWLEAQGNTGVAVVLAAADERLSTAPSTASTLPTSMAPSDTPATQMPGLVASLRELFQDIAGVELAPGDTTADFAELGLDSLVLTQMALQLRKRFGVSITFRQLMEQYRSVDKLAQFLERAQPRTHATVPTRSSPSVPPPAVEPSAAASPPGAGAQATVIRYDAKKAFGAMARIHTERGELSERQRTRLDAFMRRYVERTRKSKAYTAEHRPHLADPRVVNGFRPMTKEINYQIVVDRSKGSRIWDIDGNEYVDALNGFGMNLFGWQPDFVLEAVRKQLDAGYEIGPQHPLAGEVAELVCELTGFDRAALCNTGSEAVMAAIRIARTVTARNTVVLFTGSYHGTFDEVLVRAGRNGKGLPAAPGIMFGAFDDVRVLDYGTPESLDFIRQHAAELAAVLVEPVQSRRPELQPREFLQQLRAITERSGTCLVFDEVITGFRVHLGGVQAVFGVVADLACYGKVIGGGFPVGVVAGRREYMDALDGGAWQYGDDSMPSVGVTYFAGTFVRHPLALAAAKASLERLKQQGPGLQKQLNLHTAAMADELSAYCREVGAPLEIRHFSSLWRVGWLEDHPLQDLLFAMVRSRGVHLLDNFPCFLTTAHTPDDIATIKSAFKEGIAEMQEAELLPRRAASIVRADASRPPVPNARLGRDKDGRPAWFVPDANAPGKYIKVSL